MQRWCRRAPHPIRRGLALRPPDKYRGGREAQIQATTRSETGARKLNAAEQEKERKVGRERETRLTRPEMRSYPTKELAKRRRSEEEGEESCPQDELWVGEVRGTSTRARQRTRTTVKRKREDAQRGTEKKTERVKRKKQSKKTTMTCSNDFRFPLFRLAHSLSRATPHDPRRQKAKKTSACHAAQLHTFLLCFRSHCVACMFGRVLIVSASQQSHTHTPGRREWVRLHVCAVVLPYTYAFGATVLGSFSRSSASFSIISMRFSIVS